MVGMIQLTGNISHHNPLEGYCYVSIHYHRQRPPPPQPPHITGAIVITTTATTATAATATTATTAAITQNKQLCNIASKNKKAQNLKLPDSDLCFAHLRLPHHTVSHWYA